VPTGAAAHAHEAVAEQAAAQEGAQLALDEARHHALALVRAGEVGLELIADDRVERRALGLASGRGTRSPGPGTMEDVGRHSLAECESGATRSRTRRARSAQGSDLQ
jgi:peptidoglycan/xylan/chitin deacetylase (PgdA/CDA1 family)